MSKEFLIFLFIPLSLLASGCNNPFGTGNSKISPSYGSILPKETHSPRLLHHHVGVDMISASIHLSHSVSHRKISVSVGSPISKIVTSSTAGRTVYLNIQGQISEKQGVEQ